MSKDGLAALGLPAGTTAYICGPDSFMTAMRTTLAELGIAAERVHTELFGALGRINPGITGATGAAGATPRILGFMSRL